MGDVAAAVERLIIELVDRRVDERLAKFRTALEAAPADAAALLTLSTLAGLLSTSPKALSERFRRARRNGAPHPLEALSIEIDGTKRWRRADALAYVASLSGGND